MSPEEEKKCREILRLLSDDDVFALAKTVTKGIVGVNTRSEAEDVVLKYSESARLLLSRQKITKEVLVKYMFTTGISTKADVSKADAIDKIVSYWTSRAQSSRSQQQSSRSNHIVDTALSLNRSLVTQSVSSQPVQPIFVQNVYNYNPTHITVNCDVNYSNNGSVASSVASDQEKAEAFVKWFYQMLNPPHENYGPVHFWDDSKLFLEMSAPSSYNQELVQGSLAVAERLLKFTQMDSLLFNPNVSKDGVTVKCNPHGIMMILVCGTLHQNNTCIGIFQQSFGLINDPKPSGGFKVKVTCLKMDQRNFLSIPRLGELSEIQAIEAHTVKALEEAFQR